MTETITAAKLMEEARVNFTRVVTGNSDISESEAWLRAVQMTAQNHGMSQDECIHRMNANDGT